MNPFCPNCDKPKPMLRTVSRLIWDKYTPSYRGRAKFYECPTCKRRWKKGACIIRKK